MRKLCLLTIVAILCGFTFACSGGGDDLDPPENYGTYDGEGVPQAAIIDGNRVYYVSDSSTSTWDETYHADFLANPKRCKMLLLRRELRMLQMEIRNSGML